MFPNLFPIVHFPIYFLFVSFWLNWPLLSVRHILTKLLGISEVYAAIYSQYSFIVSVGYPICGAYVFSIDIFFIGSPVLSLISTILPSALYIPLTKGGRVFFITIATHSLLLFVVSLSVFSRCKLFPPENNYVFISFLRVDSFVACLLNA